jgi:hypothetical protein
LVRGGDSQRLIFTKSTSCTAAISRTHN